MANRVALGERGGQYGLWVSKAGVDVLTAADADLLFNSNAANYLNVIASRRVTVTVPAYTDNGDGTWSTTGADSSWQSFTNPGIVPMVYYGEMVFAASSYEFRPYGRTLLAYFSSDAKSPEYRYVRPLYIEVEATRARARVMAHRIYGAEPTDLSFDAAYIVMAL